MPYIDRYRDKHLSYYSELYNCNTVHNVHIDKLMIKLEEHYLSVDRLYYYLVSVSRLCCIDVLLDAKKYPSTFCMVRIFKYSYDTGKYIDEKLPLQLRALVFSRMAERLILIRDIKKHITRYRPQLWSIYCMNCPWEEIKNYISDPILRESLDNIRSLTDNAIGNAYYKYDDIPNSMIKYDGFKMVYDQFSIQIDALDKKITPSSVVISAVYAVNLNNISDTVKDYLGDYLTPILMAIIFYYYAIKWAPAYSIDTLQKVIEKCLYAVIDSEISTDFQTLQNC